MRSFSAKYRGLCAGECGETIRVGDEVVFVDNELMHTACVSDPAPGGRVESVCPDCFLVHTGECF